MRVRGLAWVFLGAVGCGSVSDNKQLADGPTGDVDAMTPAAPGTLRWVRSLSSLEALGVADGPGGLVITGAMTTPADLGGGVLTPTGGAALVVAGFNSDDASHLYSVRYGDVGSVFPFLHAVNASGAPIVNGVSYGNVDLGKGKVAGGTPGSTAFADGYIGVYGPGAPAWVQRIVGPGDDKIVAVAQGPGSSIYGAGWYEGAPTFNGATLPTSSNRDLFLARFDVFTGAVQLTRTYSGTGREEISGAARAGDAVVVSGMFDDTLNIGGGTIAATGGGLDVFAAKLTAAGDTIWAVRFGGTGDDRDPRVVVDSAGDVYLLGSFTGQIAFGALNLVAHGATDVDTFVAKLRGADGSVAWAISLGTAAMGTTNGVDSILDAAVDTAGHLAIAGVLGGPLDGKTSAGGLDAYVASLDTSNGALRWRNIYSSDKDDRAFAVTVGRNGDVYAVIDLGGPFDFGMPIIGAATPTSVLLRLAP